MELFNERHQLNKKILPGMIWPVEGMTLALRYFAYTMPFTLPAVSITNIMTKSFGFTEPSVLISFGIVTAWNISCIALSIKILQWKKFSRNS